MALKDVPDTLIAGWTGRADAQREAVTPSDLAERSAPLNSRSVPWLEPVDVSNAIVFAAVDLSRYITWIDLPADAG